jgi:hypothetical protein
MNKYQYLYDALEKTVQTKIQSMSFLKKLENLTGKDILKLDEDGYDIMYQLYHMFMKKQNIHWKEFIITEEEFDKCYSITFDLKKMPLDLKALLYVFAETHIKSIHLT